MDRVAFHAGYSSDQQSSASIEDQFWTARDDWSGCGVGDRTQDRRRDHLQTTTVACTFGWMAPGPEYARNPFDSEGCPNADTYKPA